MWFFTTKEKQIILFNKKKRFAMMIELKHWEKNWGKAFKSSAKYSDFKQEY